MANTGENISLLSALYRISEMTTSPGDLHELYFSIHRIVGELMYAKNFYIAMHDPPSNTLHFSYVADEKNSIPPSRPMRRGLTEYVLRTERLLLATPEVIESLIQSGEYERRGAPSVNWMGVPLKGDQTFGVLVVQSYDPKVRYVAKDLEVLTFVGQQVARVIQHKRHEAALQASEERYRSLFERNMAGVFRSTLDGKLLDCNQAFAQMFGYTRDELLRLPTTVLYHGGKAERDAEVVKFRKVGQYTNYELCYRRKDGSSLWLIQNAALMIDDHGNEITEGTVLDITDRHNLEQKLRQAQKMEAIGRLAGGIAHDFNNLLTVIEGYGELLMEKTAGDMNLVPEVLEIRRAAARAAALTNQLLAFSRQQVLAPKVLDLNDLVQNMSNILRRLLGEDVDLRLQLEPNLGQVKADPNQLEQVIMNLAVNARDAMPEGGKLTLETANTVLDEQYAATHESVRPGPYVRLAVTDTGAGMDDQTRAHMFEPFFSTKHGKGTGLGLSMVYGIIRQSSGHIWVYSEPSMGTTFKIYLPRVQPTAEAIPTPIFSRAPGGSESILVVEDEPALRTLVNNVLKKQGYRVMVAGTDAEAIAIGEDQTTRIDLLLCDVVLTQTNGRELARRLVELRPALKVLFMSGYTDDTVLKRIILEAGTPFLQKPFTVDALGRKVREVLDSAVARR